MPDMNPMMTSENGPVLTCMVEDCSYNRSECCTAPQIDVGDDHPKCDTYTHDSTQGHADLSVVGSCKVMDCYFNKSEQCRAAGITVGFHSGHADCVTARPAH